MDRNGAKKIGRSQFWTQSLKLVFFEGEVEANLRRGRVGVERSFLHTTFGPYFSSPICLWLSSHGMCMWQRSLATH